MFVSQKEKMFFTEHLALMLKGGISISEAIETLKNGTKSRTFKKTLDDVLRRISEGESLAEALGRHPRIFNLFFRNIIRVGEESGTLEKNLKYLGFSLRSEFSLRKKVIGVLIYPIIIIVIALVIALGITFFILPKLITLFQTLEIQLPLATRILMTSANFLQNYWYLVLIGIISIFLIWKILHGLKFTRFYFHRASLFLPIFGETNKNLTLARFSRTFYTLLKSGVPILESLDICIDILPNEVYRKNLISVRSGLERGEKISQNLKNFPGYFPAVFSEMILVGEKSGSLEDSLLYLAGFYEAEVDSTLKNLSGLLEPILLIFVGIFVCFVALAIITPIYQFTSSLRIR